MNSLRIFIASAIITFCIIQIYKTLKQPKAELIRFVLDSNILAHVQNVLTKTFQFPKSKIKLSKDKKRLVIAYGKLHFIIFELTEVTKEKTCFEIITGCESHAPGYEIEHQEMLHLLNKLSKDLENNQNPSAFLAKITFALVDKEKNEFKDFTRKIPTDML